MSRCTSETDDPESSINSTETPPNLPAVTVALDLTAATVITSGLTGDGDACRPLQASRSRFPGNSPWQCVPVDHTRSSVGYPELGNDRGIHVVSAQLYCNAVGS